MTPSAGKRVLKGIAWTLGAVVSLVVLLCLALLVINWRDQPPSEAALRFAALYRDRAPIPDAENGYLYMLGLDAESDAQRASRSEGRRLLPDACRSGGAECAAALESNEASMREWLSADPPLLDRYLTLLEHSGWLEAVPADADTPLPSYSGVMDGQTLLLIKAYLLTGQQDAAGVRKLLSSDVRFWRRVLASSDTLITKMIATAALNRHFGVGNLILRKLPSELQISAMPEEWRVPMSAEETSLLRTFVGEWIYGQGLLHQPGGPSSWSDRLTMVLFQEQDTSNRRAEMLAAAVDGMNVSFDRLPNALDEMQRRLDDPMSDESTLGWLYNPAGKFLLLVGSSAYGSYGARVFDIEGARRAAVLVTELRSRNVAANQMPSALSASDTRSPYDGRPFAWDDATQSIVCIGLQRGERARQAFKY